MNNTSGKALCPKVAEQNKQTKKLNNISVDFLSHFFSFACAFCCCCSMGVLLVYFDICLSRSCVCVFCVSVSVVVALERKRIKRT